MFTNYLLDAVSELGHAIIIKFIIIVIIIPFISLGIYIFNLIRVEVKKANSIPVTVVPENRYKDINLLKSAGDKIEKGLGLQSLTREELDTLKKFNII